MKADQDKLLPKKLYIKKARHHNLTGFCVVLEDVLRIL